MTIYTGHVTAFATDYESDGTMWAAAALYDSTVRIYKSTDHGDHWDYAFGFWVTPHSLYNKLGLIVGEGDSNFVYTFLISPVNNGDFNVFIFNHDGTNFRFFPAMAGPDTINNFTVCRDYTGGNYWLYACAGDDDVTLENDDFLLRSVDDGKNWAALDTFRFISNGNYSAGAGTYLYLVGWGYASGGLNLLVNKLYGARGEWQEVDIRPDTFAIQDPVIGATFTVPESLAVIWSVYSHNYQNSGDWDIKYVYSTNAGINWSSDYYLAGSSSALERFPDLKNYTSLGNTYMNASYISEETFRTVYRHYVNAPNPSSWSDTLRINGNSAGTGTSVRLLLVYSPGAAGSGAGCVFTGAGLENLYWNAPWHTGINEETESSITKFNFSVLPNPGINQIKFSWSGCKAKTLSVYDASGRLVKEFLNPSGTNLIWDRTNQSGHRTNASIYFARIVTEKGSSTRKLVIE